MWTLFFTLLLVVVCPTDALAVFQLSVSPRRGGQSVRFESAQPGAALRNEEVSLSVNTDRAVQYRILQNMYQPLTNEFGNTIPPGAFFMFSPSNPLGTLRTQLETPVSMGQSQIYTSNSGGSSDEFFLVFNIRLPEDQAGGVYRTQLTYTAEPVNAQAGMSPSTTTLEVRVEINPKFRFEVVSEKGAKSLDLGKISRTRVTAEQVLTLDITSNVGTTYRIFQQLTEPLVSVEGEILDEGALTFSPGGNAQGSLSAGANSPIPVSQSLLYTSSEWGASDRLNLGFELVPDKTQKAGLYRGNLSFRVESNSPFVSQEVINLPVTVEIESIFSLDVAFDQGRDLNFGLFKTGEEKQERRVILKVRSNLGEPYQISQVVPRKMTHTEGAVVAKENFQFFTSKTDGSPSALKPVEEGETVIYSSDKKGTPEELVVNYILTMPRDAKAGAYSSELKYSITTL